MALKELEIKFNKPAVPIEPTTYSVSASTIENVSTADAQAARRLIEAILATPDLPLSLVEHALDQIGYNVNNYTGKFPICRLDESEIRTSDGIIAAYRISRSTPESLLASPVPNTALVYQTTDLTPSDQLISPEKVEMVVIKSNTRLGITSN